MKVEISEDSFTFELELTPENNQDKEILEKFCDDYGRLVIIPKNKPNINSIKNGNSVLFTTKVHPRKVRMCDIFDYSGSGAC